MARRIRSIKPELLEDEKTAGLSDTAFRVFIGCIVMADDRGTFRADPRLLEKAVYWIAVPEKSVAASLAEIELTGMVRLYRVRGQQYGQFTNWGKHQRIDNASKVGLLPGPEEDLAATRGEPRRTPEAASDLAAGSGSGEDLEGRGSDARAQDPSPPKSGVFKSSPPPKLEPVIAEPQSHAAASLTPQATESGYDLAWRLWRGAWEAKYRDEYDRGPELGITSDHKVLQRIGAIALARADPEALLAHKFAGYLRDHGVKGYLDEHRHPLRCIERDWNKYGEPRKPRQAMPPPKPEPVAAPVSKDEMGKLAAMVAGIGKRAS